MLLSKKQRIFKQIFLYLLLSLITFVLIFPFLWMVSTSLKPIQDIFTAEPVWIPTRPTSSHYIELATKTGFFRYFLNSLIVSAATTVVTLLVSTFFAYGVSRFKFRGRKMILRLLLVSQMFPLVLLIIPIFTIFIKLQIVNTYLSLIIAYCTFSVPFATWMLKAYFDDFPLELEESAMIDGCSPIGALMRVVMPLSAPSIAAVGLYSFVLSWQEFMFALTLTRTDTMRTLPVGINMMIGYREVLWGQLMAGTTIVTIPVVILFVYFQKYLIAGMTMGAVKG